MSEARTYDTLTDLVKSEAVVMADPEKGPRVYKVSCGGVEKFAAAISAGQAALAMCEVELVGRPKLLTEAFKALGNTES